MSVAYDDRPRMVGLYRAYSEHDARTIREMAARGCLDHQIAAAIGRSRNGVQQYRRRQGIKAGHYWTTERENELIAALENHVPFASIARRLHRGKSAVQSRASRLGVGFHRASGHLTLNAVVRLLGVDHDPVRSWINAGLLRAHRTSLRAGHGYWTFIDHEDLEAFLANEDAWHLWAPERITDPGLRAWAIEQRRGLRFLTCREVAPLLHMTPLGVQLAIRDGRLRGVQKGPRGAPWLVRTDWVEPPRCTDQRGIVAVPFTPAEVEFVRRHYGNRPMVWIARQLGRTSETAIAKWARRLGLPPLGRGYWRKVEASRRREGREHG